MEFRILGSLQVCEDGREIPVGGGKKRALLARLLVDANRRVSEDVLIEALWPEHPPAKAADNLHVLVSRLRKALGADRIVREAGGYLIRIEDNELDLARFSRLCDAGRFEDALAVWRGAPLADFTYDAWAQQEIGRLEELRLAAVEHRIEGDLEVGRHAELIGELRSLVADHPLREGLRRHLIVALYRSERQAEALEAYHNARRMLDEELGLEPSPALRELEGAVLRHDPSLRRPPMPSVLPQSRRSRVAVAAAATAVAGFAAAMAAIPLLDGDDRERVAAAVPPPAQTRTAVPTPTSTTRVVVIRERLRPAPAPSKRARRPAPPRVPLPAPDPAPAPAPSPAPRQPQAKAKPKPAATPKPSAAKPKPAKVPFRLSDSFDDGVIDRAVWQRAASNGTTIEERNGRLEVTIAPEAVAEGEFALISASYGTTCRFLGDFDARVEFELLEWPDANGALLQLAAWFNDYNVGVARQSQRWAEEYGSWMANRGRQSPSSDRRGAFRVRRTGHEITTFYRRSSDWYPLQTRRGFDGAPLIGLQLMSRDDWFADKAVRVAFDNFSLVADERAC